MKKNILFVDDEPNILGSFRRSLREWDRDWNMTFVDCPMKAWALIQSEDYDLVVIDVRMPVLSGLDILKRMQADARIARTLVIVVTGDSDANLKRRALELGATDLLNKPVHRDDLVARISSAMRLKSYQDELIEQRRKLERIVQRRTKELEASRLEIIWRLARAAEFRDEQTGNHVVRVAAYSRAIAKEMGLSDFFCANLFLAAPLHDIGKIGIPDSVLLKEGHLTEKERSTMRRHCQIGNSILRDDCRMRALWMRYCDVNTPHEGENIDNTVMELASSIAMNHHEKWDGSGYPRGLKGEEIPIEARIVAVSDVFDALCSDRPYKSDMSVDDAFEVIREGRGSHFDPQVYDAFAAVKDKFVRIASDLSGDTANPSELLDATSLVCR